MTAFGKYNLSDTSESGLLLTGTGTSPGGGNILKKAAQVKSFLPIYESDVNFGRSGSVEAPLCKKRGSRSSSKNLLVIIGFWNVMQLSKAKCSTCGRTLSSMRTCSSALFWYKVRESLRTWHRERSNSGIIYKDTEERRDNSRKEGRVTLSANVSTTTSWPQLEKSTCNFSSVELTIGGFTRSTLSISSKINEHDVRHGAWRKIKIPSLTPMADIVTVVMVSQSILQKLSRYSDPYPKSRFLSNGPAREKSLSSNPTRTLSHTLQFEPL